MKLIIIEDGEETKEIECLGAVLIYKRKPDASEDGASSVQQARFEGAMSVPEAYGLCAWAGSSFMDRMKGFEDETDEIDEMLMMAQLEQDSEEDGDR